MYVFSPRCVEEIPTIKCLLFHRRRSQYLAHQNAVADLEFSKVCRGGGGLLGKNVLDTTHIFFTGILEQ
jgi:hypothetical protein